MYKTDYSHINLGKNFKTLVDNLVQHFLNKKKFKQPVFILFDNTPSLAESDDVVDILNNKTGMYDVGNKKIVIYVSGRHPKDILRSLAHELIHHIQNCNGSFDDITVQSKTYTQDNPKLRELEREAYEQGNMMFRDWEDNYKYNLKEEYQKQYGKILFEHFRTKLGVL